MKLVQDNYLDQITEDLEFINFRLGCLLNEAIIERPQSDEDDFSLLEQVELESNNNEQLVDLDKFEIYNESVASVIKSICKNIIRFIRMVFTSSGMKFSTKDVENIINDIKEIDASKAKGKTIKTVVQKGFYLIAGLGTSVDGASLKRAYDNGNIVDFVTANIGKININKIPQDATLRISLATYDSNVIASTFMTKALLKGLNTAQGIKSISGSISKSDQDEFMREMERQNFQSQQDFQRQQFMAQNMMSSVEYEPQTIFESNEADIIQKYIKDGRVQQTKIAMDIKYRDICSQELQMIINDPVIKASFFGEGYKNKIPKKQWTKQYLDELVCAAIADCFNEEYLYYLNEVAEYVTKIKTRKRNGDKIAIAAEVAITIAPIVIWCVQTAKESRLLKGKDKKDHLDMAVITYINENRESAVAKVRLYDAGNRSHDIDIKGKEKINILKNDMIQIANDISETSKDLSTKQRELLDTFAQNILTVFSGLATK